MSLCLKAQCAYRLGSGAYLVVAAGSRKSENLPLPEEFSPKIAAKVAG
jgi:hypothetical protein